MVAKDNEDVKCGEPGRPQAHQDSPSSPLMGTETLASKFPCTLGRLTLEDMASVRLDGSGFQDAAQRLPRRRSEV